MAEEKRKSPVMKILIFVLIAAIGTFVVLHLLNDDSTDDFAKMQNDIFKTELPAPTPEADTTPPEDSTILPDSSVTDTTQ